MGRVKTDQINYDAHRNASSGIDKYGIAEHEKEKALQRLSDSKVKSGASKKKPEAQKEVVTFGKSEFDKWKKYAEEEGYSVREAGNLPGSYAAYDKGGKKVGHFMNEFDLPNGVHDVGELVITTKE